MKARKLFMLMVPVLLGLVAMVALLGVMSVSSVYAEKPLGTTPPTVDGLLDESYTFLKHFEKSGTGDEALAPGNLYMYTDTNTCYWAFVVDRAFNDNVFADSDSAYLLWDGWTGAHTFGSLEQSDGAQFVITNTVETVVYSYTVWLDYLNEDNKNPGQYRSGQSGDGYKDDVMSPISDTATSLYYNMTQSGWITETHSPDYDYNDTLGQYWEWQMIYEFSILKIDMGGECGDVDQGGAHNSPSKDNETLGKIGNYVWHDPDINGLQDNDSQDDASAGIANVTVNLYDDSDTLIRTTQTAPSGYYIFNNLEAGNYYVEFVPPTGYKFTLQDVNDESPNPDERDSDVYTSTRKTDPFYLPPGETDLTWDAGLHLCALGDRVWHDEDKHGDQNATLGFAEPGINGVDVYLYATEPITCGASDYLAMMTTITGTSRTPGPWPDGIYGFDMESPVVREGGTYWVCVDESSLPGIGQGQWYRSPGNTNPRPVTYTKGTEDFGIDFGYYQGGATAITLSSLAARPSAGGSVNPLWLGLAGLTVLAAGSLFWAKRRAG